MRVSAYPILQRPNARLRWVAVAVFIFASVLNYLDRLILATVAPLISKEFHLTNTDYGLLVSAFSIAYALSSPFAGWFLDRAGLNRGIGIAVGFWSVAGLSSAFIGNFAGLVAVRAALGIGESAGIPAVGKLNASYLEPKERALGAAVGQTGLSIGGILAPPLATVLALHYGWRRPFLVTGFLGLLWIPVWSWTARRIPPAFAHTGEAVASIGDMLHDARLFTLIAANVLWMGIYTLWSNWTTLYLVQVQHQTLTQAAWYAWIPPLVANAGGFLGGWLSLRWIGRGMPAVPARLRAILFSAIGSLITIAVPVAPGPLLATAAISLSYFWATAGSVNLYTIPLDLYGAGRAAFAVSALVFAYGLLQTVLSPVIGFLVDRQGYGPVCWLVAILPLGGWALMRFTLASADPRRSPAP